MERVGAETSITSPKNRRAYRGNLHPTVSGMLSEFLCPWPPRLPTTWNMLSTPWSFFLSTERLVPWTSRSGSVVASGRALGCSSLDLGKNYRAWVSAPALERGPISPPQSWWKVPINELINPEQCGQKNDWGSFWDTSSSHQDNAGPAVLSPEVQESPCLKDPQKEVCWALQFSWPQCSASADHQGHGESSEFRWNNDSRSVTWPFVFLFLFRHDVHHLMLASLPNIWSG